MVYNDILSEHGFGEHGITGSDVVTLADRFRRRALNYDRECTGDWYYTCAVSLIKKAIAIQEVATDVDKSTLSVRDWVGIMTGVELSLPLEQNAGSKTDALGGRQRPN